MDDVRRQDSPPKRRKPIRKLVRVLSARPLKVICLSLKIWGFWSHWTGTKSIPCTSERGTCPGHLSGWPLRWKGILHVLAPDAKKGFFIELTPRAADMLGEQVDNMSTLRGLHLTIERSQGGKNGRLSVFVTGKLPDCNNLPAAEDPYETLRVLWGWQETWLDEGRDHRLA